MSRDRSDTGRLPWWLRRLGRGGVLEATVALLIFLFSEINYGPPPITWPQYIADAALALFTGASGRWPRIGGIGGGIALMLVGVLHGDTLSLVIFCTFIPVVSTGAHGYARLRDSLTVWYTAVLMLIAAATSSDATEAVQSGLVLLALMCGTWATGRTIGRLREESSTHSERQVEALRAQRRTIARDLHDTVAYATTTMIMRAEQIKLRSRDAELNADLEFIITTGRRSVRDLRGMLEALRRNDPSFDLAADTPWRIVEIEDVLENQRAELAAHGLTLAVTRDTNLDDLPGSVRETAAKLVVEATSNMVKHAAPGPCRVLIDLDGDNLELVFTNKMRLGQRGKPNNGLGLLGAAERIEALGGVLEATQASDTWILSAQLPLGGE
ncbi:MAG: sensor histidine kinase [Propioniciclava sp.]